VASSVSDPDINMPDNVSAEYGSDINILRLHDLKHGSKYVSTACDNVPAGENCLTTAQARCTINSTKPNGTLNCLTNKALVQKKPVVCQVCHYTPALDLAHVGPKAGAPGTEGNGRNQIAHQSNSRVMRSHHGTLGTAGFPGLFRRSAAAGRQQQHHQPASASLENSATSASTNVKWLRGAMFNGGCSQRLPRHHDPGRQRLLPERLAVQRGVLPLVGTSTTPPRRGSLGQRAGLRVLSYGGCEQQPGQHDRCRQERQGHLRQHGQHPAAPGVEDG
jgi:hypothetical protein